MLPFSLRNLSKIWSYFFIPWQTQHDKSMDKALHPLKYSPRDLYLINSFLYESTNLTGKRGGAPRDVAVGSAYSGVIPHSPGAGYMQEERVAAG